MKLSRDQVEFATVLLGKMCPREDARKVLREKYGVDDVVARRLLRAAKKMLRRWVGQAAEDHFLESASFYRAVLQGDARLRDKLVARERLDELNDVGKRPDAEVPTSVEEAQEAIERIVRRYELEASDEVTYVP